MHSLWLSVYPAAFAASLNSKYILFSSYNLFPLFMYLNSYIKDYTKGFSYNKYIDRTLWKIRSIAYICELYTKNNSRTPTILFAQTLPKNKKKALKTQCFQGFLAGDERIELPPKVLETPIIPFDQSPIYNCRLPSFR